jgi:hypothetical protein
MLSVSLVQVSVVSTSGCATRSNGIRFTGSGASIASSAEATDVTADGSGFTVVASRSALLDGPRAGTKRWSATERVDERQPS